MPRGRPTEYLAECFWPGVQDADLRALDDRATAVASELAQAGEQIRYLGSLLMRADEVVLCLFQGSEPAVRRAAERAQVPFERILEAARSPWPDVVSP
jgi:Nickel responsive protein SCO4226-like